MQITKFALFSLLGLASAAPTTKQDIPLIKEDLALISNSLDRISSSSLAFTGGIFDSISLITAVSVVEGQVSNAAADIEDGGALSLTDSTAIVSTIETISTKYVKALGDLQAKSSQIARSSYKLVFHTSLLRIRDNTNFLSNSLHKEIDASLSDKITSLLTPVFAAFDNATAAI